MRQAGIDLPEFFDESGYCLLGAKTLLNRTRQLNKEMEGVRREDQPEYVHRLRVASRRVRVAIGIFEPCFRKKRVRKSGKAMRNLTRSFGAARDADVQESFLETYAASVSPGDAKGLEYLISLNNARRAAMRPNLVNVLAVVDDSGILEGIIDACSEMIRELRKSAIKTLPTYERAHQDISARLDEMQSLEQFVHDESAIAKHHELRIAAKRLRYTMEIFSSLYGKALSLKIPLTEQFQDILGETHDYDVWIQDLKSAGQRSPPDAKDGINNLVTHLIERRKSRYQDFIRLWDSSAATGFLGEIREITDTGPNSKIISRLLHEDEKVALISDIHGNLEALGAVIGDAKQNGIGIFLNAGDAVGFGIYPSQVVRILGSSRFLNVIGNVDLEVLGALRAPKGRKKDSATEIALRNLSPSDVAYLQSLPKEIRLEIDGKKVFVTHGSPDSVEEHIYPDSPEQRLAEIAAKTNADIIITGHTHMQMRRNIDGVMFVNPGSVGRPVDGDPSAEYAILSFNPVSVEFRKVNYDVEALADEIRKSGLPESYAQVQLRAIPLKAVGKQEEALIAGQLWRVRSTITRVRTIARGFLVDEAHSEQDRKLALAIFDRSKQLHSLGKEERYWLECAAILHDIGLSRDGKGHHKTSLKLILNDHALPFTQKERYIIGSITRYHRKALPSKKHFNLAPLNKSERAKTEVLAAILRVADALDYSHKSIVRRIAVKPFPNRIVLECVVSGDYTLEDQSVRRKKDLFEKVFKSELTVVWKPEEAALTGP